MTKTYDRGYFDKWYRDPAHAVASPAELRRKVAMVVAQAEYYLGRPIANVLDVGCGEGSWRAPLRKLRPGIRYRGLDASEYAVSRYGRSRNIGLASFGQLEQLRFDARFDLIVCTDVLHYLAPAEIRAGLVGIGEMLEGIAFLEVFTSHDDPAGDRQGFRSRTPHWYLHEFHQAGLLPCGSHCYLGPRLERHIAALERAQLPARR
jgi:SAM-dependent methyltransferase